MLLLIQALLAVRVFARMAGTARGRRIERVAAAPPGETAVAIVPVLDEAARLAPCLAGLRLQGDELAAVLVVDGGSRDGTVALARRWSARDPRVRVIEAGPAPDGVNGKVHNLTRGFADAVDTDARWILTVDADVRPAPGLVAAMLAHAAADSLAVLSLATEQRLSGPAEALVHPSLLATLVYRFGIPGHEVRDPAAVQANGQCMLLRRDALDRAGGFIPVRHAVAEDVALARRIAALGEPVGFFEGGDLATVEMYAGAREAIVNWSRSLPLGEGTTRWRHVLGLAEVVLVQAAPLPLALALVVRDRRRRSRGFAEASGPADPRRWLIRLNLPLLAARFGVLAGAARAYPHRPATYWLSPASDAVVAAALLLRAVRRRHVWRGRIVERERGGAR